MPDQPAPAGKLPVSKLVVIVAIVFLTILAAIAVVLYASGRREKLPFAYDGFE